MAGRGKRLLVAAALVTAAAAMILAVPLLVLHSSGFRDWLGDRALTRVLAPGVRLRIDRIEHLGPGGIRLEGLRVEAAQDAHGWTPWLRIGSLSASWVTKEVLSGRYHLGSVEVDSVRVELGRMPASVLAPRKTASPVAPQPLRVPPLRCPRVTIRRALVRDARGRSFAGNLLLRSLEEEGGRFSGLLEEAGIEEQPENVGVALSGGRFQGEVGRALKVDSLSIVSQGLSASLSAAWRAGRGPEDDGRIEGVLGLRSIAPEEVGRIRELGLPLHQGDLLTGRISFAGSLPPGGPPAGDLAVDLAGRLFGQALDSLLLQGTASPDSATLHSLRLRAGGLRVEGNARWIRSGTHASARLDFSGCDLSSGVIAALAPGLPSSRLAGTVEAEADSIGPRLRLAARIRLEPGLLLEHPLSGVSASAVLDPSRLTVESLETAEPGVPQLVASGVIDRRGRTAQATGVLHDLRLGTWVDPWVGHALAGTVSGPFEVEGPLQALRVRGDVTVRKGHIEKVFADSLHVGSLTGVLSPVRLSGTIAAKGLRLYTVVLDSLRGDWSVADTIRAALIARRDTTSIRLQARVVPGEAGRAVFDSLRILPGSAPEVELAAPATLEFSRRLVHCDSLLVRSQAGTAAGSGWLEPRPGAAGTEPFGFHVEGKEVRLGDVVDYFGLSHEDLDGTAALVLDGGGRIDAPVYRFRGEMRAGTTYGWNWERLSFAGAAGDLPGSVGGETGGVRIDSLRATSSGYAGSLPGPERTGPEPPSPSIGVSVDSLEVLSPESWASSLSMLRDSLWTLLDASRIRGALAIRALPVAPLLSHVLRPRNAKEAARTLMEPVDPMLAVIRVEHPESGTRPRSRSGIGGRVSLRARWDGTGARPRLTCDLTGRHLRVYEASADSVLFQASYRDSLLTLQTLNWHMGSAHTHSEGTIPLLLTTDPKEVRLLRRPLHVETRIPEIDLSLASLATRVIQAPSGTLSGSFTLEGIPPGIYPMGELAVHDGAFRIQDREDRISGLEADLRLDSTGVQIEKATGLLNETGKVTASGYFRDIDHFDLTGSVRDGLVYQTGDYRFVVDGDVRARPVADGDTLRPELSGKVTVQEGLLTVDLAKPPPPGLPPRTPWLIDVEVIAPGNIRVNQPAMTVDVGQADLMASFRWPYWNLAGTVQVLDGTYRIFNRIFNVTSGTVTFEDIGQGPRPILDVQAQTEVAGAGPDSGPITVVIAVKGPPEQLDVTMSAQDDRGQDLAMSQAQLIEMLSVGQLTGGQFGSFRSSDPTRQYLSTELVGQIERQLVQQVPYADRVQLVGEIGGDKPLVLYLRPIVQPQWYLDYSQELSATPERKVSVNYRLSNLLFLNAGVDRAPRPSDVPLDTYSLDLKLRIEY